MVIAELQKIITHQSLTYKQKFAYLDILCSALNSNVPEDKNVLKPSEDTLSKFNFQKLEIGQLTDFRLQGES
jgi:hypothetical protein